MSDLLPTGLHPVVVPSAGLPQGFVLEHNRPQTVHMLVELTSSLRPAPPPPPAPKPVPKPAPTPAPAPAAPAVAVVTQRPVASVAAPPTAVPVSAPTPPDGGVWAELRNCESGGNYAEDSGNGYYGAYQFSESTWLALGYSGLPSEAAPAVQDAAASRLQATSGWDQWPACSAKLGL